MKQMEQIESILLVELNPVTREVKKILKELRAEEQREIDFITQ